MTGPEYHTDATEAELPGELCMSEEEFSAIPWRIGWDYEYTAGRAFIRPSGHVAVVRTAPEPRATANSSIIRAPTAGDEQALASLFAACFEGTADMYGRTGWEIEYEGRLVIRGFFRGRRVVPDESSRVAIDPETNDVIGAILVARYRAEPFIYLLFVADGFHRRGVASALAAAAVNDLAERREGVLRSYYLLANEPSRRWHERFGFVEEPNIVTAQHYYRHAEHELGRAIASGADTGLIEQLRARFELWSRRLEMLERVAWERGYDAVLPRLPLLRR